MIIIFVIIKYKQIHTYMSVAMLGRHHICAWEVPKPSENRTRVLGDGKSEKCLKIVEQKTAIFVIFAS